MKTEAPNSAGPRPSYIERNFSYRVTAVPGAQRSTYRIEARSQISGFLRK